MMRRNMTVVIIAFLLTALLPAFAQAQAQDKTPAGVVAALRQKTIPEVAFRKVTLESALEDLKKMFAEGETPLNIRITLKIKPSHKNTVPLITFAVQDLSALEVLRIVAEQSEFGVKVEPGGVTLTDADKTIQLPHALPEAVAKFAQKLKSTILPSVSQQDAGIFDVLDFLSGRTALNVTTQEQERVNIVLMEKGMDPLTSPKVTYKAVNVSFLEALKVVCQKALLEYRVEDGWVRVSFKRLSSDTTIVPKITVKWK
jgi:hypothetical protein